jgi:NAD(P)-dependent dehydrogenase (short-subunit alcohol dehydrogenase family)
VTIDNPRKAVVVIGATGDVGRGIVAVLVEHGHTVVAVARNPQRLIDLAAELGNPANLHTISGSVTDDESAAALLLAVQVVLPVVDAVVVSVNGARKPAPLLTHSPTALAALINQDLITHYTAARAFAPALSAGGVLLGIGGGSCDFVLHEGVPQSVAQGGLRMLYRGLAHEFRDQPLHIRELIIASVVNGLSTRAFADPLWVTEREVGQQVLAILENPAAFPDPILRIARRDRTGRPLFTSEGPNRLQGFKG